MKRPRYVSIREAKDGQFYYVLVAGNYKDMDTSETFRRLSGCVKSARSAHPGLEIRIKPKV